MCESAYRYPFLRPVGPDKQEQYAIVLTIGRSHCRSIPITVTKRYVKLSIDRYLLFFIFLLFCLFWLFFSSSGGWGKLSPTHFHAFSHMSCVDLPKIAFRDPALGACPSVPAIALARAVPIDSTRCYSGSASYSCNRMRD